MTSCGEGDREWQDLKFYHHCSSPLTLTDEKQVSFSNIDASVSVTVTSIKAGIVLEAVGFGLGMSSFVHTQAFASHTNLSSLNTELIVTNRPLVQNHRKRDREHFIARYMAAA